MDDLIESRHGGRHEASFASTSATIVPLSKPPPFVADLLDPAAFADKSEPFIRKIIEISQRYLVLFARARRIENPEERLIQLEIIQQDKQMREIAQLSASLGSRKSGVLSSITVDCNWQGA